MADQFYNDIRDTVANDLLTDFGRGFTLREKTGEAFNEMTGFVTPGTNVDHSVTGIFSQYLLEEIDGSNVLRTDYKIILSAVDPSTKLPITVPRTDMLLLDGTSEFKIVDVRPIKPGGVDVIYNLQVRM